MCDKESSTTCTCLRARRGVSKEALVRAMTCEQGYRCLVETRPDVCAVRELLDEEVLLLETTCKKTCESGYKYHFKEHSFCACPVRKELFQKFGL